MHSPKRLRDEEEEQGAFLKKLCQGLGVDEVESAIHGVLADEQDEGSLQPFAEGDFVEDEVLSGVMRSLEEEIALSSGSSTPSSDSKQQQQQQKLSLDRHLSYLFEASDDELGISATEAPSSPALSEADFSVSAAAAVEEEQQYFDFSTVDNFIDEELLKRALVDMGAIDSSNNGSSSSLAEEEPQQQQQQQLLLAL